MGRTARTEPQCLYRGARFYLLLFLSNLWLLLHCGFRSSRSRYTDSLRAGQSADRIPVGTKLSAPVKPDLGAHLASY
jgi:hypothetical protein